MDGSNTLNSNNHKAAVNMPSVSLENNQIFSQQDVIAYLQRKGLSLESIKRLQIYDNNNNDNPSHLNNGNNNNLSQNQNLNSINTQNHHHNINQSQHQRNVSRSMSTSKSTQNIKYVLDSHKKLCLFINIKIN